MCFCAKCLNRFGYFGLTNTVGPQSNIFMF